MRLLLPFFLLAGCQSNNSAAPTLDVFARTLVCKVPGASVDIRGHNLEGAHLEILRRETVVGVPVTEQPLTPTTTFQNDTWHVNLDGVEEGAYDVSAVKGVERWTTMHGLGILPPPSVTTEEPTGLCNAQAAQTLTVRGSGFVVVGSHRPQVTIRDAPGASHMSVEGDPSECVPAVIGVVDGVQLCNALAVTLPPGQLDPGLYYAEVLNPTPLECASTETRPFLVNPAPAVFANQTTATICQGGGSLEINGSGFVAGATVAVGGVSADAVTVTDNQIIANFNFSPLFLPGSQLGLTVANPDGCRSALINLTVQAGPVLLAADPPMLYKPLRTPVTLYMTSVTGSVSVSLTGNGAPVPLTSTVSGKRVIAEVPPGLNPGTYDVTLSDGSGCGTGLRGAVQILDEVKLQLDSVHPAFGDRTVTQRLTIRGAGLKAGARVFLSPKNGTALTPVGAELEYGALHAVVPPLAAGRYDVVVINPDGAVGILNDAVAPFHSYQAVDGAIPVVTRLAPQALPAGCSGCQLTVDGAGFGVAPQVRALCYAPGSNVAFDGPALTLFGSPSDTEVIVEAAPLAALPHGTSCHLRVTNNDAAITPSGEAVEPVVVSAGLSPLKAGDSTFEPGPALTSLRRAPAVAAADAEPGSRFLYALGGDSGTLTSARSDGEFAPLSPAGLGSFAALPRTGLPSATTLAGAAVSGRFLYLVGGHDGMSALARVARAEVLDPAEAPRFDDLGVALDVSATGVPAGATYYYRVSTRFALDDAVNPNGESLASAPIAIAVAPLAAAFDIALHFVPGTTPGRSLAGWRLYRGTAPDQLDRYVDISDVSFTDDNTQFSASQTPLVLGALGRFTATNIPQLNNPRAGAAVVSAPDAVVGRSFVYAAFGWSGASLPASYEMLQLDGGTPAGSWAQTSLGTGRWLLGGWAATPERNSRITQRFVYFGQGVSNTSLAGVMNSDLVAEMNIAQISGNGTLTPSPSPSPAPTSPGFGYGSFGGGDALVMVGGAATLAQPGSLLQRAVFSSPPVPDAWTPIDLLPSVRFLPGAGADGPYLFVIGGGSTFFTASTETSAGLF
jgi:hypothetical protein